MKHLLIFAANFIEYQRWVKGNKAELKEKGLEPRYIPTNGTAHLGFKDCFYTEVGTYYKSARNDEVYRYFESHNIVKI